MSANRPPNLLADLRPKRAEYTAGARRALFAAWLGMVLALSTILFVFPNRTARGVVGVFLLFLIIGGVVGWLAGAGRRLSSSGRDPTDFVHPP